MTALAMMITNAGFDAIVAAESGGTDEIRITEIGLSDTPFIAAPTIEALPGEFKRIDAVSGQAVSENVIHVTAYDPSPDMYDVTGIGIYTSEGILLAVYSAAVNPVLSKAQLATGLVMFDIAFANNMAALIEFGDALFLNPPASEDVKGVAEIATNAEADAGVDDTRIMSPRKTKRVLDALANALNAAFGALQNSVNTAIADLRALTITGGGLVSGGGNLYGDRILWVYAASSGELQVQAINDKALTPASFGGLPRALGGTGYAFNVATGQWEMWGVASVSGASSSNSTSVTFPTSFPLACDRVMISPEGNTDGGDEADENLWAAPGGTGGFTINRQGDGPTISVAWRAWGR